MQKTSGLAIVSLGLAGLAAWYLFTTEDGPPLMGVLLGLIAFIVGLSASRSIRRSTPRLRGRGLAISGTLLGGAIAALSVAGFIGFVLRQVAFQDAPRNGAWDPERGAEDLRGGNPMPNNTAAQFTSNLPIAILDTRGQGMAKHRSTVVHARFFVPQGGRASVAGTQSYDGLATIHLRGYSTLRLPKVSYTMHTVDSATNQTKVALLGLPAEEDWVLYAPFEDKTMIRDVLAYELARRSGHYAPRTRYFELFIRNSDRPLSMKDYVGVYVLIEKIKRGKERVNIAKLTPENRSEPEITGGYIVKRDHA